MEGIIVSILIFAAMYLLVTCILEPITPLRFLNKIKYDFTWLDNPDKYQCPKCLSLNTTLIEERTTSFPNAFRPKGIFCNCCGRQTPDFVKLDTRHGSAEKWLTRRDEVYLRR